MTMEKISVSCNNEVIETFELTPECCQSFRITPRDGNTKIRVAIPMVDIHAFWHCNTSDYRTQMTWHFSFTSALNHGMPFLAFFNSARQLCASVATDNLIDDTLFDAMINQQNCTFDVTLESTATEPFNLIVDLSNDIPFTQSLAEWRNKVIPANLYFPAGAWYPVFCTWYAVHGEVTAKWIESQAVKARALGFGTLIVDDGWCYDEFKRVSPETLSNWYNTIGDWEISEVKFPDFKNHVKKIKDIGLKFTDINAVEDAVSISVNMDCEIKFITARGVVSTASGRSARYHISEDDTFVRIEATALGDPDAAIFSNPILLK